MNLILKGMFKEVEAILGSLEQYQKMKFRLGSCYLPWRITETDIDLAAASGSVIIGFNTSLASGAKELLMQTMLI